MKRAQMIGQVFIFLLGALVFLAVLLFGYKGIKSIQSNSEKVAFIDLENDIIKAVESIKLDYGSVKKKTFRAPSNFKYLCFLMKTEIPGTHGKDFPDEVKQNLPMLYSRASGTQDNVFLIPLGGHTMSIPNIVVRSGCFCAPLINGRANVRLESIGNAVIITDDDGREPCEI